jgi:DNA (cytosine-5)-methyltransferase 1
MMSTVGLFAGVGGIEIGLEESGFETIGLCEFDPAANAVLNARFPDAQRWNDVRTMPELPQVDVVTAGFPCQDLSQAGRKAGITGSQSGLVENVFRLLDGPHKPTWLVIENVSYMLRLDRGAAMHYLVSQLEARGYRWAYRVVDSRAFGIPQRRQRVIMVASTTEDPCAVLFADEAGDGHVDDSVGRTELQRAYGFYWTEGLRGLGWTRDAVPTVKGGSRLGIPSAPGVWVPRTGEFGTPGIADLERLQGLPAGWTGAAEDPALGKGGRWRLVGNAVCAPVAGWLGRRLVAPGEVGGESAPLSDGHRWGAAAWGEAGRRFSVDLSMFPEAHEYDLQSFLDSPLTPLSVRAASGFASRAAKGKLKFSPGFLASLDDYIDRKSESVAA